MKNTGEEIVFKLAFPVCSTLKGCFESPYPLTKICYPRAKDNELISWKAKPLDCLKFENLF